MRIALFGGTFDPIHRGHKAIAQAAAAQFALDQILFAPAGRQPLKPDLATASFADRLAMTKLACDDSGDPGFVASALDAPRDDGTPNYTIDTLTQLASQYRAAQLFCLTGADSFSTIAQWRDPHSLLNLAEWIVVSRPGFPLAYPKDLALSPAQRTRIHLLDSVHEDIAATHLRTRLAAGDPCTDLLAPSVARYIQQHRLYRASVL
jgi:nicotinate-nucleotide adenylyltransferase